MTLDLGAALDLLQQAVPTVTPAAQVAVWWQGQPVVAKAYGWYDPATMTAAIDQHTLFDLASVTKLFVVTAFMALVEAGAVELDQPVVSVLPELGGQRRIAPYEHPVEHTGLIAVVPEANDPTTAPYVDMDTITFRQLLAHHAGLPAWRPLYRTASRSDGLTMALTTAPAYPIGSHVVYSDIGLVLLGQALERLTRQPLATLVAERVTRPLELHDTHYLPVGAADPAVSARAVPTEECRWRGRRIQGEVHDENAASLGGVSGHAGLFSTAQDVACFGQAFLPGRNMLLRPATVMEMTRLQAAEGTTRRGLGFALWSNDPEAGSYPLSPHSFGHTGFTGTSLWVDPERTLVVALLTNEVYHGRDNRGIRPLSLAVHSAIVAAVDAAGKQPLPAGELPQPMDHEHLATNGGASPNKEFGDVG